MGPTGTRKQGSGEDYITRRFMRCILAKYYSGHPIKNEKGGACGTHGGIGERHTGIWWGDLRKMIPLGRLRYMWENNIKMDIKEVGWKGLVWIALAQDRER